MLEATINISPVVAAASAIGGGVVVAISNYWIRRADLSAAERTELRTALVGFLHVLALLDLEMQRQPEPGRLVRATNRLVERLPQLDYITGRLHERLFTPHLQSLMDRFAFASNRVLLVAPLDLLPTLHEVSDLMAHFGEQPAEWFEQWQAARGRLAVACRTALGQEVEESLGERDATSSAGTAP